MADIKQAELLEAFQVARQMEEDQRSTRRDKEEHAKRAHDLNRQISNQCRSAAVESANVAIRSLILINGGAVVALLAFVGAIESSDLTNSIKIEELVAPIFSFAVGVGGAAIAAILAYLVNMLDADITNSVRLTWEHPYVNETKAAARLGYLRIVFHVSAFVAVVLAIGAFFRGVYTVTQAISSAGL